MNHFIITKDLRRENDPQRIEITLSPSLDRRIMQIFEELFHVAILQGEKNILEDGSTYYSFMISKADAELIRQALLETYTKISGYKTDN